jgi:predicted MFS family arabinose efflux permease
MDRADPVRVRQPDDHGRRDVQVWQTTKSTAWTGAVGLAQAVPLIVLGLFAGSLVDRMDRRRLYLFALYGQVVCSLLFVLQGLLGQLPAAGVLGLVAVRSCLSAVGGPAARTFAAALYGASGLPPMGPGDEPGRPGLRGVLDGLAFLARTPVVRGALLTDLAATVLSMPISLFPLVNAERFGDDPRTLGLFLTAIATGGVAVSLFSGSFTRLPRPGLVMLGGSAAWGAALTLFGLSAHPWAGLACLVLAGAADTVSVVARSTIVQTHTPRELLGRVGAAEQIVGQAGPDLGNLRGGLVADATSGATALISGGLLCLGAVALVGATTPGLRRSVK